MGCLGKLCKGLVFLITTPLLLIISLVGFIIWLPLALIGLCCPCVCLITCIEKIVEGLIKLPIKMVKWAFG